MGGLAPAVPLFEDQTKQEEGALFEARLAPTRRFHGLCPVCGEALLQGCRGWPSGGDMELMTEALLLSEAGC